MAKTRLQAKYTSDEESGLPTSTSETDLASPTLKKKERYSGAVDCLTQVYNEKGVAGWYQVRFFCLFRFRNEL